MVVIWRIFCFQTDGNTTNFTSGSSLLRRRRTPRRSALTGQESGARGVKSGSADRGAPPVARAGAEIANLRREERAQGHLLTDLVREAEVVGVGGDPSK